MKEYAEMPEDTQSGKVKEALASYATPLQGKVTIVPKIIMDELLHQSNDVKLLIIQKLSESMRTGQAQVEDREAKQMVDKRKEIEAKLDELHVTGALRRLIGAVPYTGSGDYDWKKEKEAYLMEKYGE